MYAGNRGQQKEKWRGTLGALYAFWVLQFLFVIGFAVSAFVCAANYFLTAADTAVLCWIALTFLIPHFWSIALFHVKRHRSAFNIGTFFGMNIILMQLAIIEAVNSGMIAGERSIYSSPFVPLCVFSVLLAITTFINCFLTYYAFTPMVETYQKATGKAIDMGAYDTRSGTGGQGLGRSTPPISTVS
uniref:Uncharacterized protein n=1 Tax=Spongospora subterranea TaxID=70186 RepID=A0A0H5QPH1_9EUKA|eukprot:CRZ03492.1 hypothetical protein [Spongospora subterranea]